MRIIFLFIACLIGGIKHKLSRNKENINAEEEVEDIKKTPKDNDGDSLLKFCSV